MLSWLEHFLKTDINQYRLLAIYTLMVLESACIPIPSEVVMPYAGYLVAAGQLNMAVVTVVAAAANLTGSWLAYAAGKFGGRPLIEKYGRYVFLSPKHVAEADEWFAKRGEITVFVSRMLPGIRTFISLPAGITGMNFIKFSLYSFLGAVPWNLALVYLGYIFTNRWNELQSYLHRTNLVVIACLAVLFVLYILWKIKKEKQERK